MRVYVPAAAADLRRLEIDGRLGVGDGTPALAVTPWALAELGLEDPEDEIAEYAVLGAAAEQAVDGADPAAVLVFELAGDQPAADGLRVDLEGDLPRRRLVAVHVLPGLDWYAGHELPDVIALLT